jgi:hypothetical protein
MSASYTVREVDLDDLGDIVDDDNIRDGLVARESVAGARDCPLGDRENWHWGQVLTEWEEHVAEQLAVHDIGWDTNTHAVTLPDGMTDADARQIWEHIYAGFGAWLDRGVAEVLDGRPAPSADIRDDDAPGWSWVIEALDN